MTKKLVLVAAVALFGPQGRILLAKRPEGKAMAGLWEFPGGKLETGETPEAALVRELQEELGIKVAKKDLKPITFASFDYQTFHLLMPLFACETWQGTLTPLEGQTLEWVERSKLHDFPAPDADIPLFDVLVAKGRS